MSQEQLCDSGCTSLTKYILQPLLCHVGVSALAHEGSFPAGGILQSHAFPLPSAFCCEYGGWSNLIALGGELEEEGLCFSFGRSRSWVEKQVPGSKAAELAFGHPRCKASTPSIFFCQREGAGWGMWVKAQRLSTVPCCPTGNDMQPVPSPSRAHHRLTIRGVPCSWHSPCVFDRSLYYKTENKKCRFGSIFGSTKCASSKKELLCLFKLHVDCQALITFHVQLHQPKSSTKWQHI